MIDYSIQLEKQAEGCELRGIFENHSPMKMVALGCAAHGDILYDHFGGVWLACEHCMVPAGLLG
jgi:hypothetical protein